MRIGIVNDLGMAREALRRAVLSVPGHQVVWMAGDGSEAIEKARLDLPDLILMDLVMPGIDGVEATRRIMAETPCPILVVTATVSGHMGRVFDAMGHGALDTVDTPTLGPRGEVAGATPLIEKIAIIAKLIGKSGEFGSSADIPIQPLPWNGPLILIGSSTGGPNALAQILADLPVQRDACTIIVQHVDSAFAPGLATWLGEKTGRRVDLIQPGDRPGKGQILLAATNDHLTMDSSHRLRYTPEPIALSYRPSVDVFFNCVATHWPRPGIAAVLTGMGRDGAKGLLKLRQAKWFTIAQDQATSIVWGMPRAAAEVGAAIEVLPIERIGKGIVEHLRRSQTS
ncbi:chemotaxis-specific protein-glutamate methyltransferase CheB [Singulisphaera sp. Ch08]|uniref:protein-glutamate methylesterase n=1 Tax=Singulisphaera sp. Ch08 TaxID=3120278 RepID=A0AAU7CNT9_9BACT